METTSVFKLRTSSLKTTPMKFKFENLIIWQKAMDLGEDYDDSFNLMNMMIAFKNKIN